MLQQCAVDTYRASGPGGQKRNKTSSAVRLRHLPSGLIVIAEESRSQHQNKEKALRRLHQALFLKLRESLVADALVAVAQYPEIASAKNAEGRFDLGRKDPRFWPTIGIALDVLDAALARVHDAATALGVSTANFLHLLQTTPQSWAEANALRQKHGHKPLRVGT